MKAIAIVFSVISLIVLVSLFRRFRNKRIGTPAFLLWSFFWLGFLVFSLYPKLLDIFLRWTMMTQRMNFSFVAAIFFLLVIVNYLFENVQTQKRKIARLAQNQALLRYKYDQLLDQIRLQSSGEGTGPKS